MSTAIVLKMDNLPSHVKAKGGANKAFMSGVGGAGYPFLSIKGKNWTVVRADGKKLVTRPDDPDSPASYIDVVLVAANEHKSKVFYSGGYTDGSNEKPTCFSDNGSTPANEVADKQSKSCATCKHNVWGTGPNGKGRACRESRRVAVAPIGQLNDPMLLRVPPTSLTPLSEYVAEFDRRGVDVTAAITRLKFDSDEATPKIVFAHRGWLDEEQCDEVAKQADSEVVKQIIGVMPTPHAEKEDAPAPKSKKVVDEDDIDAALQAKPAKKAPVEDEDEEPVKAKKPAVDEDDEEPVKPKKPAKKESKVVESDDLDAALAGLDDL